MGNKKGFTLIELVVSIVLVSVVLVTLIGSLIQIRNAYTVVHENSDVIVYTSSVSRVINSDINENNGIRYVSCEPNGKKCSIILGNDSRRELIITDNDKIINDTESKIKHTNNKTTLKYFDTTKYDRTNNENDKKLIYIRTLELNKYENSETKVTTTDGYNFYDMSASQYEYNSESDNNIDAFTTITIRLLDGVNMDVSNYNIVLYGAGRYDYSKYVGRVYKIDLDNDNGTTAGTTSIDEVFGVGYYKAESAHKKKDEITKIEVPTKEGLAFLGYYYKPYGVTTGVQVIDAGGNIVADARTFKNDVVLNEEETGVVKAKWGACEAGFKIENGKCVQEVYTVTLNKDTSGKTCTSVGTNSYTVGYQNLVKDVIIPECAGYTFEGYLDSTSKIYHNRDGQGIEYYDKVGNTTFKANWHACSVGQYSLANSKSCTDCVKGSYASSGASGVCTVCQNGKTTSGTKSTSCNTNCPNNNSHVATWTTAVWNDNNTITNNCKIATCKTGYDGELSSNKCTVNNYKIAYNLDGGSYGTYHPTTATYDQVVTISNPTRAGYAFTGWTFNGSTSTAYHGSTLWSNQSTKVKDTTFKNLTPTDEATVTLTANWSACPAGYYNDGTSTSCTKCAIGSITSTVGKTSCTACQASGQTGTGGTTSTTGKSTCDSTCNKAHVSTWQTAVWNSNNTISKNCVIEKCVTGYTLSSNACTPNTYTISYNLNGGSYGANHPTNITYDNSFTVNNPSRTGYTFAGWKITGMDSVTHTYGGSTTTATSISSTTATTFKNLRSTSGTVTFTAQWNINSYKLTVNPNGGVWNGSSSSQSFNQNYTTTKAIGYPSSGATYTISYNANSQGATYTSSPTSVQRPFSSWSLSGSGSLSGTTYTYGAGNGTLTANYNTTSNAFTLPAISKSGYKCKWAEGSASGTQYEGGTSRTVTSNKTYYAVCTIDQIKKSNSTVIARSVDGLFDCRVTFDYIYNPSSKNVDVTVKKIDFKRVDNNSYWTNKWGGIFLGGDFRETDKNVFVGTQPVQWYNKYTLNGYTGAGYQNYWSYNQGSSGICYAIVDSGWAVFGNQRSSGCEEVNDFKVPTVTANSTNRINFKFNFSLWWTTSNYLDKWDVEKTFDFSTGTQIN